MLFLNPLLLWGLLAASVPVLIHLHQQTPPQDHPVGGHAVPAQGHPRIPGKKKLRHILILTCRALAIAALAFAAARPIVSGLIGWGGGSIDTVVLLLDRSASMETKPGDGLAPRRQIVIEKVRDAMKTLGATRLVLIDSASGRPQEIPSPDVLAEIAATAPTDTAADFPTLLARAAEFLSETTGRSEVWLASDLQTVQLAPRRRTLVRRPRQPRAPPPKTRHPRALPHRPRRA